MIFDSLSDETLAQRAVQDVEAFSELYQRYADRIYRYFYSRVQNTDDAEDLTAQTFFALLKGISRYRSSTPFSVYVFAIAYHKLSDFLKKPSFVSLGSFEQCIDPSLSVENIVEEKLEIESLLRHLSTLPPTRSEAITLRIFAGLTSSEIAQVMQKTEGAVNVLVHRALSDLRELVIKVDV